MYCRRKQHGFTFFELATALAVIIALSVYWIYPTYNRYVDDLKDQATARYTTQYANAAVQYIQDNYADILQNSGVTTTTAGVIDYDAMAATGNMPTSVQKLNPYGQASCLRILKSVQNANHLIAIITTEGGTAFPGNHAAKTAAMVGGGMGGVISADGKTAQGLGNTWQFNETQLASFKSQNCSGTTVSSGHLAIALFFSSNGRGGGRLSNDLLYRHAVPGHPEANQMTTALGMSGNHISNANSLTASGVAVNGTVAVNGLTSMNASDAASSTLTVNGLTSTGAPAALNVQGSMKVGNSTFSSEASTPASIMNTVVKQSGALLVQDASGAAADVYAQTLYGNTLQPQQISVANQPCNAPGLIAQDMNGGLLNCQSGYWVSPTGASWSYSANSRLIFPPADAFNVVAVSPNNYLTLSWGGATPRVTAVRLNKPLPDTDNNTYTIDLTQMYTDSTKKTPYVPKGAQYASITIFIMMGGQDSTCNNAYVLQVGGDTPDGSQSYQALPIKTWGVVWNTSATTYQVPIAKGKVYFSYPRICKDPGGSGGTNVIMYLNGYI